MSNDYYSPNEFSEDAVPTVDAVGNSAFEKMVQDKIAEFMAKQIDDVPLVLSQETRIYPDAEKSDGGPSGYYDFPQNAVTWNDVAEEKAVKQWGAFSYHIKDIGKAVMRFGAKDGTSSAYDARKIIYSGLRLLGMIEGKDAMRKELQRLLEDKQFQ